VVRTCSAVIRIRLPRRMGRQGRAGVTAGQGGSLLSGSHSGALDAV